MSSQLKNLNSLNLFNNNITSKIASKVFTENSRDINKRDEQFARIALNEADKSNMKYHQHGCIAVMSGQIIARGHNSDRCHSNDGYLSNTCSCHAEIDVMRKLEKRLNKNSSVMARNKPSCFLRANKPVCRKKRQKRRIL